MQDAATFITSSIAHYKNLMTVIWLPYQFRLKYKPIKDQIKSSKPDTYDLTKWTLVSDTKKQNTQKQKNIYMYSVSM